MIRCYNCLAEVSRAIAVVDRGEVSFLCQACDREIHPEAHGLARGDDSGRCVGCGRPTTGKGIRERQVYFECTGCFIDRLHR
jgi:hypothetical protein